MIVLSSWKLHVVVVVIIYPTTGQKFFGINLFKEQINLALGSLDLSVVSPLVVPKFLYGSFNIPVRTGVLVKIPSQCDVQGIEDYTVVQQVGRYICSHQSQGFKNKN